MACSHDPFHPQTTLSQPKDMKQTAVGFSLHDMHLLLDSQLMGLSLPAMSVSRDVLVSSLLIDFPLFHQGSSKISK